jgi:hypothetical protein
MLCAFFSCASSDVAAPKLGEDGSVALALSPQLKHSDLTVVVDCCGARKIVWVRSPPPAGSPLFSFSFYRQR